MPHTSIQFADSGPALRRGRIHVLKAGTWPADPADLTLTDADLAQIAAGYDPARFQAPVVVGHPKDNHPAYGWVLGLRLEADGLWADVEITSEMADAVAAGHFRTVSVSLWPPGAPGNPRPEGWSLRHIGFLGAHPPAVKGLKPLQFGDSAAAACVTTYFDLKEHSMPDNEHSAAAAAAELADKAKVIETRAAELAEREAKLAARELEIKRAGWRSEIDTHVKAGRVLPAEADGLVALMERLDGGVVTLAEAEQPAIALLTGFLSRLPARVDLSERAADTGGSGAGATAAARFKVPDGYTLSEYGARLHAAAVAYQTAHPGTDFVTAVKAVAH
jgi:hypothetical protein